MSRLRQVGVPVGLALAHVRRGGARTLLVLAGVALASACLAAVVAAAVVAENRSLARALRELDPPLQAVRVGFFGVPGQAPRYGDLDRAATRALAQVSPRPPVPTMLLRESSIGGAFVGLGAVDGLRRWVRVVAGRLPRACTPDRCEAILVRGAGDAPRLRGLSVVGRGVLRTSMLFGDAVPAERNRLERAALAPRLQRVRRYHQPAEPPLLLVDGVDVLARAAPLSRVYRSYGWVLPLVASDVRAWRVGGTTAAAERARAALQAKTVEYDVVAPVTELREARAEARVGARRLLLLGGQAGVLALAFAAFAATRLRREAGDARRRLVWLGTPSWQVALATIAQALLVGAGGALAGWAIACGAVAAIEGRDVARHALLDSHGAAIAGLVAVAAAAVVAGALAGSARRGGRALDTVAVALAAACALALARGAADADELLASRGTGAVVLLLPAAVAAVGAVATIRLLAPALRALARAISSDRPVAMLATLTLARRPLRSLAAVAFLVVSVAFAVFANGYRETLVRSQHDRAAYALGADVVLREDLARLIPVREVATPARLRALPAVAASGLTLRASGNVPGLATATGVIVLGLEPRLLASLRGWRADFGPERAELRRLIERRATKLRGARLPPGAATISLSHTLTVAGAGVEAVVEARDGTFDRVTLPARGSARLPRALRGGKVVALRLVPPPRLQERGADAGRPVTGTLRLGALRSGGRVVSRFGGWSGTAGATRVGSTVRFTLTNETDTYVRPRQATDDAPVPVVASPRLAELAGRDRVLPLQVAGVPLRVRVAAVAVRFPSARGEFAVAQRGLLETAMNVREPGSGMPTEAWVNASASDASRLRDAVRRAPWDVLDADVLAERERRLRADPVARVSLALLVAAALTALGLALVAVVLATLADVRDDRAELVDLEAQGAAPGQLRRIVRLRQGLVLAAGVGGGLATGLVLTAVVVAVVAVAAGGARPEPPLVVALDPVVLAAAVAAVLAAAGAVVLGLTRGAFSGAEAGRVGPAA